VVRGERPESPKLVWQLGFAVGDDSRAVCPDCFVDRESAPGRRSGLDAAKSNGDKMEREESMSDYQQTHSGIVPGEKRLNQLRKRRKPRSGAVRIIPRWLIVLVIVLFFAAQVIAFVVNTKVSHPTARFPAELKNDVALASLALAGS